MKTNLLSTKDPAHQDVLSSILWGGIISLGLYILILILSFEFIYGEGHAERPLDIVLGSWALLFVIYFAVSYKILHTKTLGIQHYRAILLTGIAFRLVLLPSTPIQEIDYYRYLWDGQMLAQGYNPFKYAPAQIDHAGPKAAPGSEMRDIWDLTKKSETIQTIFSRVHHRQVATIYPPVAQVVFAISAWITPASANLFLTTLLLKIILLLFDLGTWGIVILLLQRLRLPRHWSIAYAWCPLLMKEISNSAHLDAIAVFFTTLSLYFFVKISPRADQALRIPRSWIVAGIALGLGILAKSYPVILLPVLAAWLYRHLGRKGLYPILATLLTVLLGYVPFINTQPVPENHSPVSGLSIFLSSWEMNDFLFMIVHENVRPAAAGGNSYWFVVTSESSRLALISWLGEVGRSCCWVLTERQRAFMLTRVIMAFIFLLLILNFARNVYTQPSKILLLRSCFLSMSWLWLLSSAANPWYLLWSLPLLIFSRKYAWWLLLALAMMYYVRFYLEYQSLTSVEAMNQAHEFFDFGLVWWEYVPFYLLLVTETWWFRSRRNYK